MDECYIYLPNPLGYIQDYVNTYVSVPETEATVNDQMAAYEERELNVHTVSFLHYLLTHHWF